MFSIIIHHFSILKLLFVFFPLPYSHSFVYLFQKRLIYWCSLPILIDFTTVGFIIINRDWLLCWMTMNISFVLWEISGWKPTNIYVLSFYLYPAGGFSQSAIIYNLYNLPLEISCWHRHMRVQSFFELHIKLVSKLHSPFLDIYFLWMLKHTC